MKRYRDGVKPRITDVAALQAMVADFQERGMPPEEIHREVVRVAVVDLDELNELLKAA